jgi:predicted small metal-binding protein
VSRARLIGASGLVRCACAWEASGPEDEIVAAAQEHGRRVHNMLASRDEVLAMAVAAEPANEPGDWPAAGRPAD